MPMYSYWPVSSLSLASAAIVVTRPVRRRTGSAPAVSCVADGVTPVARLQRGGGDHVRAGSVVSRPKLTRGTSDRVLQPHVVLRPGRAARDVVVALQPGDVCLRSPGRSRYATAGRPVDAGSGQLRADVGEVRGGRPSGSPAVRVHVHVHVVEELDRRAAVADAELVDEVAAEGRTQRVAPAETHRGLTAAHRESRQLWVVAVQRVGRVREPVVVDGSS